MYTSTPSRVVVQDITKLSPPYMVHTDPETPGQNPKATPTRSPRSILKTSPLRQLVSPRQRRSRVSFGHENDHLFQEDHRENHENRNGNTYTDPSTNTSTHMNSQRLVTKTAGTQARTSFLDVRTPYVVSLWLQLGVNVAVVLVTLYFVVAVTSTIRHDVNTKVQTYTMEALEEILMCSREYYRNRCQNDQGQRPPALERPCTVWQKCMNRDPGAIGRSKVTAETVADIINGLVQPLSWKAMAVVVLLVVGTVAVTNGAFSAYRNSVGDGIDQEKERIDSEKTDTSTQIRTDRTAMIESDTHLDRFDPVDSPLAARSGR